MDPEGRQNGVATPLATHLPSDPPPGLTSSSSSPQSSQNNEEAPDLAELRRQNEEKLQGRFQSIYAKYGRDFGEISDEIDLVTGEVIVSNGHLKCMRHERDVGPPSLLDAFKDQDTSDDQQEPPELPAANQKSIASLISTNPASWSKPGAFDQYFSNVSKNRVVELVQNAVQGQEEADPSDSSFLQTFSQNIVEQVARLMHTLKSSEVDDLKAILPSVLEEQLLAKQKPTNATGTTNEDLNTSIDESDNEEGSQRNEIGPSKWEPSIWEDTQFDFSPSRSVSPAPKGTGSPRGAARKGSSRRGLIRWTKEEDDWLISLKTGGTLTYREISSRFPDRSYRAVRQRFRFLVGKDPAILAAATAAVASSPVEREVQNPGVELSNDSAERSAKAESQKPELNRAHYSSKRIWTPADDELIIHLREKEKLTWSQVANYLPGRSADAIGWRYYFRLQKGAKKPVKTSSQSAGSFIEEKADQVSNNEIQTKPEDKRGKKSADLSNMDTDSPHDSGCSFSCPDIEMGDVPVHSEVGENSGYVEATGRRCMDESTSPSLKKRKRPAELLHIEARNDETSLHTLPGAERTAIPIDPMLLQPQVHISGELPDPREAPNEVSETFLPTDYVHAADRDEHLQRSDLTPRPNKSAPGPWPQQKLDSPTTTPSRQLQWSLSDAIALVQNNRGRDQPTTRHSYMIHDIDDGLGSEDELGQ